jgi:hypothetical protein
MIFHCYKIQNGARDLLQKFDVYVENFGEWVGMRKQHDREKIIWYFWKVLTESKTFPFP